MLTPTALSELTALIRYQAPHADWCPRATAPCRCWKRDALALLEPPLVEVAALSLGEPR